MLVILFRALKVVDDMSTKGTRIVAIHAGMTFYDTGSTKAAEKYSV